MIDTNKPLEVVANWDKSLVWKAEFVRCDKDGDITVIITEDFRGFQGDACDGAGTLWMFFADGTSDSGDLTLRNVQPKELTWGDIKDAFSKLGITAQEFGDAVKDMIEPRPEETPRSLVVAREVSRKVWANYQDCVDMGL